MRIMGVKIVDGPATYLSQTYSRSPSTNKCAQASATDRPHICHKSYKNTKGPTERCIGPFHHISVTNHTKTCHEPALTDHLSIINRTLKRFGGTFVVSPSRFTLTYVCRKILGGENALHLRLPFCGQSPFNQRFDPQNLFLGVRLKSPPRNLDSAEPATETSPGPFSKNKKS